MRKSVMAARTRLPLININNYLQGKLPTLGVVCGQWFTRRSSNFFLVADGVGFAIFCVALMASSWFACALSDVCTAANGGPF